MKLITKKHELGFVGRERTVCTAQWSAPGSYKKVSFCEFLGRKQKWVWLPNKAGSVFKIFDLWEMSGRVISDELTLTQQSNRQIGSNYYFILTYISIFSFYIYKMWLITLVKVK